MTTIEHSPSPLIANELISAARLRRHQLSVSGRRKAMSLSTGVVLTWATLVSLTGQWDRVLDNVAAAATMVFGSFVAGSTPQGGGAVAFPVFTKLLGVDAADAATFSLSIQAIGMGSAAAIIALTRRAVDTAALKLTVPAAIVGYLVGVALFSVVALPSAYTKVFFTLAVVAAGAATVMTRRRDVVEQRSSASFDRRSVRHAVLAVAAVGGLASSLFGSGADIAVYLLLTIVLGVRPGIGVATSVITMAAVSVTGLAVSLLTGALSTAVVAGQTDIFGMWLAAVPVVVIGAPIGSWFASRVSPHILAFFIAALAALELVSTALFLEQLRTDPTLATFAVVGLTLTAIGVHRLLNLRDRLAVSQQPQAPSIRRADIEIGALQ